MNIRDIIDFFQFEIKRERKLVKFMEQRVEMISDGFLGERQQGYNHYYYLYTKTNGTKQGMVLDPSIDEHREVIKELMEKKTLIHGLPLLRKNIRTMERGLTDLKQYHPFMFKYGEILGSDYYLEGDVCIREWKKKKEIMNPYRREDLVQETKKGVKVRSKSEGMISDMLYDKGILYKYETALKLGGKTVYPDFEILHPRTGELIWWEHLGKADSGPYVQKNLERLEAYGRSGIIQGKNLIVTSETLDRPLTRTTASRKLREYGLI